MGNKFDAVILKKLRVEKSEKALIINAPQSYLDLFSPGTFETGFDFEAKGKYDFVQVFGTCRTELESLMVQIKDAGKFDCLFWACYPKGGGKIKSDLKREIVWASLELIHLRPVSQIALNETWSALRGRPHSMIGK
jgi:hypothetical protein